jgi:hypothetical protein
MTSTDAAKHLVGPEREKPLSQLPMIRRLGVIAAPGQLNRWATSSNREGS